MPSPKNPLDGGGSIQGAPNKTITPRTPSCEGGQFADSPSGGIVSADSNYLDVSRDQYWNEITEDRPMHAEATPRSENLDSYTAALQGGRNRVNYGGRQYDTIVQSPGDGQYGVAVGPPQASRGGVMVTADDASRGKDS